MKPWSGARPKSRSRTAVSSNARASSSNSGSPTLLRIAVAQPADHVLVEMGIPPAESRLDDLVQLAEMEPPGDHELAPYRRLDVEQGDAELHGGRFFPGHPAIMTAFADRRQPGLRIIGDATRWPRRSWHSRWMSWEIAPALISCLVSLPSLRSTSSWMFGLFQCTGQQCGWPCQWRRRQERQLYRTLSCRGDHEFLTLIAVLSHPECPGWVRPRTINEGAQCKNHNLH